jgi:hypothetical protein
VMARRWCMVSYYQYVRLAADPVVAREFGVQMRTSNFFFKNSVVEDSRELAKMEDIMRSGVIDFRHSKHIIKECRKTRKRSVTRDQHNDIVVTP